jgi:hypothetical protein
VVFTLISGAGLGLGFFRISQPLFLFEALDSERISVV